MKKLLFFISILLLIACEAKKDNLIWSDEFDYAGLPDSTKWDREVGYIRNHELQYYTDRRIENSTVKDGNLLLIGIKEPYDSFAYTSASINTLGKFSVKYGKIEARMKLPTGQGKWPAFWMMGENRPEVGWPKCGEIDIMEHINSENILYGTAHWDKDGHKSKGSKTSCNVSEWHNYAVEWDADSLRWLLDDKRYFAVAINDTTESMHEFHKPHYLLLNFAIGGDWPKSPDSTSVFPDTVFVDYVRVYSNIK